MDRAQSYRLEPQDLREFARLLLPSADEFIAPVRGLREDVVFAAVAAPDAIETEFGNPIISPVSFLFPACEQLFSYAMRNGQPPAIQAIEPPPSQLIFGIRPCDVAAIEYLDSFFLGGEYADDVYAARRRSTAIVAMSCAGPQSDTCWCTCSDAGPVAKSGFDLQLSPVAGTYLLEVGTERGAGLAMQAESLLSAADDDLFQARDEQVEQAWDRFERRGNLAAAMRWITGEQAPADFWQDLGARCFSCGSCSFVCPVCTCFDTYETAENGHGVRMRCWDSCRYPGYSLEASGFNPRADEADRARHYAHHKLCHGTMQQQGRPGCVGCGRCVQVCLGQIHLPLVAEQIRERGWEAAEAEAPGSDSQ